RSLVGRFAEAADVLEGDLFRRKAGRSPITFMRIASATSRDDGDAPARSMLGASIDSFRSLSRHWSSRTRAPIPVEERPPEWMALATASATIARMAARSA